MNAVQIITIIVGYLLIGLIVRFGMLSDWLDNDYGIPVTKKTIALNIIQVVAWPVFMAYGILIKIPIMIAKAWSKLPDE